jgi:hypothetical protein
MIDEIFSASQKYADIRVLLHQFVGLGIMSALKLSRKDKIPNGQFIGRISETPLWMLTGKYNSGFSSIELSAICFMSRRSSTP